MCSSTTWKSTAFEVDSKWLMSEHHVSSNITIVDNFHRRTFFCNLEQTFFRFRIDNITIIRIIIINITIDVLIQYKDLHGVETGRQLLSVTDVVGVRTRKKRRNLRWSDSWLWSVESMYHIQCVSSLSQWH